LKISIGTGYINMKFKMERSRRVVTSKISYNEESDEYDSIQPNKDCYDKEFICESDESEINTDSISTTSALSEFQEKMDKILLEQKNMQGLIQRLIFMIFILFGFLTYFLITLQYKLQNIWFEIQVMYIVK